MLADSFVWGRGRGYGVFPDVEKLGEEALVPCDADEIPLRVAHRPEQLVVANGIEHFESRGFIRFDIEPVCGEAIDILLGWFTDGHYIFFEIDKLPCQIVMLPGVLGRANHQIDDREDGHCDGEAYGPGVGQLSQDGGDRSGTGQG